MMLPKFNNVKDIDTEEEYKNLDKLEVALANRDNAIFETFLTAQGFDVEGIGDTIGKLWIALKKILKSIGNLAKKLWLKALIWFAKNDDKLSDYRSKVNNKLVIDVKNKGEVKEVLKKNVLAFTYGFPMIKTIDNTKLFKGPTTLEKDIVKGIPNADAKIVDFLTGKTDIRFITFLGETAMFIVRSKEGVSNDQYIKVIKHEIDTQIYNKFESDLLDKVDNNNLLPELKKLFTTVKTYEEIKKLIGDGFKSISTYEDEARKLSTSNSTSYEKSKFQYDTLKGFSRYTYSGLRQIIHNTKLAIKLGDMVFESR